MTSIRVSDSFLDQAVYDNQIIGHISATSCRDFILWYKQGDVVTRCFFNDEENCAYNETDTIEGMKGEISDLSSQATWNITASAPRFPTLYHSR